MVKCRGIAAIALWLGLSAAIPTATATDIVFGYSTDDSPVSYYDREILGFCGALYKYLDKYVGQNGQRYSLIPQTVTLSDRFGKFITDLKKKPGIYCGATSITRQRKEILQAAGGEYSHPFAASSTKMLIRTDKLDTLYTQPERVRIGIARAPVTAPAKVERTPATSELIGSVFSTAVIVPLASREDAVRRLQKAVGDPEALDAYASSALLLQDMLNINLGDGQQEYVLEPPSDEGYARHAFGVVVYHSPELLNVVNHWIDGEASAPARAKLIPKTSFLNDAVTWLNHADHLALTRFWLAGIGGLLGIAIVLLIFSPIKKIYTKLVRGNNDLT
jgi:hypothetical protein